MEGQKKCNYCAMMIPKDAKICPFCRKKLQVSPIIKYGLLILLILWIIGKIAYNNAGSEYKSVSALSPEQIAAKQQAHDNIEARSWAKIYVQNFLKAPSTAKFQSTADFIVSLVTDKNGKPIKDVWVVEGYVDAQNSFGAMLRNQFTIKLQKVGDNKWIPLNIVCK